MPSKKQIDIYNMKATAKQQGFAYDKMIDFNISEHRYGVMRDAYIRAQAIFTQLKSMKMNLPQVDAEEALYLYAPSMDKDDEGQGFIMGWLAAAWAADNGKQTQEGLPTWKDQGQEPYLI